MNDQGHIVWIVWIGLERYRNTDAECNIGA